LSPRKLNVTQRRQNIWEYIHDVYRLYLDSSTHVMAQKQYKRTRTYKMLNRVNTIFDTK